jgi:hypothetical protein
VSGAAVAQFRQQLEKAGWFKRSFLQEASVFMQVH